MQHISEIKSQIIGLDPGSKRCGVAKADPTFTLAFPVGFVYTEPTETLGGRILDLTGLDKATLVVSGLPIELSGKEGEAARLARELAESISTQLGCELEFIDERFTTAIVLKSKQVGNRKGKRPTSSIDADAAALILQSYLDRIKGSRT